MPSVPESQILGEVLVSNLGFFITDVLYCPETILSLVGLLQRLSACQKDQRAPDAYVAFTIRNPETCQMFTTYILSAALKQVPQFQMLLNQEQDGKGLGL